MQDRSIPITKKNMLSVACQFYDPAGLATPLTITIRSMYCEICRDKSCSMLGPLSTDRADKFKLAVGEILKPKDLSFPQQIVFNKTSQLYIFFYGSLQGYCACIYMHSQNQFNILTSSAKIMGKSTYSTPQSEISAAVLAVKMEQKISQELYNVSLSNLYDKMLRARNEAVRTYAGGVRLFQFVGSMSEIPICQHFPTIATVTYIYISPSASHPPPQLSLLQNTDRPPLSEFNLYIVYLKR